jgi:hypothetical protein
MTELIEQDIRELRQQGDLGAYLRDLILAARTEQEQTRALVLAQPDLADRLTKPPISFARPDCWTGYIAPERLHTGQPNLSPIRAALIGIVTEAQQRRAS